MEAGLRRYNFECWFDGRRKASVTERVSAVKYNYFGLFKKGERSSELCRWLCRSFGSGWWRHDESSWNSLSSCWWNQCKIWEIKMSFMQIKDGWCCRFAHGTPLPYRKIVFLRWQKRTWPRGCRAVYSWKRGTTVISWTQYYRWKENRKFDKP